MWKKLFVLSSAVAEAPIRVLCAAIRLQDALLLKRFEWRSERLWG